VERRRRQDRLKRVTPARSPAQLVGALMRIDFRMDGGIAAFPGLAKPVSIDCEALPPADTARLRTLVQHGAPGLPCNRLRHQKPFVSRTATEIARTEQSVDPHMGFRSAETQQIAEG